MSLALTPRQQAQQDQGLASDPAVSAWVEASAGSGKTKLLTDRVLRLLLAGVSPGRILCLTFTRAAAAEMATRLNRALGVWAVAEDAELARQIGALTERPPRHEDLAAARTLFLKVLEHPGGMRISTIHAFCQALLRGFPLEAGLAPQFGVVEDQEANALLASAREAVLAGGLDRAALRRLAGLVPPERFAKLVRALTTERVRLGAALQRGLAPLLAEIAAVLDLEPGEDEESVIEAACKPREEATLLRAARLLGSSGNEKTDQRNADAMAGWLGQPMAGRAARWEEWASIFLTKEGNIRKTLCTKDKRIAASYDEICTIMLGEAERVQEVEAKRAAARLFAATAALLAVGAPVLTRYKAAKEQRGMLDYDDLIEKARLLLHDPGSAWVLFKLDGGLDHVLLDEAQDSNPAQWGIVGALTSEFFAGEGAREEGRTVFAVGDVKQSIYRFQGADAAGFHRERGRVSRETKEAEAGFRPVRLRVSFRSVPAVLSLVDAVFAGEAARRGVVEPSDPPLHHLPDRDGQAGEVELWPPISEDEPEEPPAWAPPETPQDAKGPAERLANALAARIAHMLAHERLPSRRERGKVQPEGRPVRPGDILVLVRKRAGIMAPLVRALKQRGIPVGGADRIALVDQLAVQDVLALCDVLLLPEDDLTLAAVLKSPLLGLDEEALFELAHARQASVYFALAQHRGAETPIGRAADLLAGLAAKTDRIGPHELISTILNEFTLDGLSGRARLLARLGPDAADALDELLSAALDYEGRHPPSLQGFLHHLRQGGAEVKREAEAGANLVRIMTVHGAKGLQAPIVILPDTMGGAPPESGLRWVKGEPEVPLWAPRADGYAARALTEVKSRDAEAEAEESHRLLYVALTRAEDRLLICGWFKRKQPREGNWYDLIADGFSRLPGVIETPFDPTRFGGDPAGFRDGVLRRYVTPQAEGAAQREDDLPAYARAASALPDWARRPAATESGDDPLAPSHLPGENQTPSPSAHGVAPDPRGERFRRGLLIHSLLQHLPELPVAQREEAARRFLARPGQALDAATQAETLREVMAILELPALAPVFGEGSLVEAPIAGTLGGRRILGQVDRVVILPDRVIVADYKTNRPPPTTPEAVAPLYLRQMAAYRALIGKLYPERRVEAWLVWTWSGQVMPLPPELLDRHLPTAF
ncbi:double-strand break repair helicase AddA [Acetobacteraceae bacterium H6797]|nr:double-strand break repair helicase AddA [Acetobacteraceae bacterium H6797]